MLERTFLGTKPCFFAQRISQSTMCRSIVLLCDDITHVKSTMVNLKTNMMCETFHKQDIEKKETLEYLVDCKLNSKFNVQPVNGKSAKCLSLVSNRGVDDTRTVGFHHCQLTDDGLTLFSRRFCSSDNCYCFL